LSSLPLSLSLSLSLFFSLVWTIEEDLVHIIACCACRKLSLPAHLDRIVT
jgi:hypothetical protein